MFFPMAKYKLLTYLGTVITIKTFRICVFVKKTGDEFLYVEILSRG